MPSGSDSKDEREKGRGRKRGEEGRSVKKRKKESCLVTNLRKCSDTSERIESALLLPSGRFTDHFVFPSYAARGAGNEMELLSPRVDSEDSAS